LFSRLFQLCAAVGGGFGPCGGRDAHAQEIAQGQDKGIARSRTANSLRQASLDAGLETRHRLEPADAQAAHPGIWHGRVSVLVGCGGGFFNGLTNKGASGTLKTAARVLAWFAAIWPAGARWPADIRRPTATKAG
jgi:hypothetical protein